MSNYNSTLQSNNTDLQAILNTINELPEAASAQATPVISVNSSTGLITATAGTKSSTHQLAFQAAKTITPTTQTQIAVSSGYYTGGNITVGSIKTQTVTVTPTSSFQGVMPTSGYYFTTVFVPSEPNLVAGNIKSGTSIFGVTGTYAGSGSSGGNADVEDSLITRNITNITNNRVTTIGKGAFLGCTSLTNADFPAVTTVGPMAFSSCDGLATISFPAVKTINMAAFYSCIQLTAASFPEATVIGTSAFFACLGLTSTSFPKALTLSSGAFQYCSKLTTVNFPAATSLGNYAFSGCRGLVTAVFPNVTDINMTVFAYCEKLSAISFPAALKIGSQAFLGCYELSAVNFPVATSIYGSAFFSCSALTTARLPAASFIGSYAFSRCYNLTALYLTGSKLCKLSNSNAFTSTPIGGYSASAGTYGSIYVPASLLASYKTATNWTYFSSRFVGV